MSPITQTTESPEKPNKPYQQPDDRRQTEDPRPAGKQPSIEAFRRESTGQFYAMSYQDRVAYEKYCDDMVGDFKPQTHRERSLAVAIAEDTWRLSRARAIENNIFALGMSGVIGERLQSNSPEVHAAACHAQVWLRDGKNLQMLALYESRIRRSVEKNEKQLRELQAERTAAYNQVLEEEKLLVRLAIAEAVQDGQSTQVNSQANAQLIPAEGPLETTLLVNSQANAQLIPADGPLETTLLVNGFGFSPADVFRIVRREMRLEKARLLLKPTRNGSGFSTAA